MTGICGVISSEKIETDRRNAFSRYRRRDRECCMSETTTRRRRHTSQLGHCLKAARQARGLTLKQVAERTGHGAVDPVEGRERPDVADLRQAAAAHLRPEDGDRGAVQSGGRRARRRAGRSPRGAASAAPGRARSINTKFYTYTYQCTDLIGKRMVPIMAEVRARSLEEFGPLLRHAGEEYFLVTSGTRRRSHRVLCAGDPATRATASISTAPWATPTSTPARRRAKGVCLCTSEAPDLYDQLRQIASREVAPLGDDELPS